MIELLISLVLVFLLLNLIVASRKWKEPIDFNAEFTLTLPGLWIQIGTPDFTIENPKCRPSWLPRWELMDNDAAGFRCEARYMFRLDWIFHLCLAWGKSELKPVIPKYSYSHQNNEDDEYRPGEYSYSHSDEDDDYDDWCEFCGEPYETVCDGTNQPTCMCDLTKEQR